MSDALTPLRHAYDVAPLGAPLAPGGAGHSEQEALRQLRALLDEWPAPAPSPESSAAVRARAAAVTAVLEQTEAAVAQAVASRPPPRPSADVLAAVLARAAEPAPSPSAAEEVPAASAVEAAVLTQSAQALDRLPRLRPNAAVMAAVEARAAETSAALAPIRALYLDGPAAADTTEGAVLVQSRDAVERAIASRPQPRPSADAVAAVLARAAEASGVEPEPVLEVSPVEAAVFAQSFRALDRLPRPRPSSATLDAVRLAAVTAGAAPARPSGPSAPDRGPARPSRRRTPIGVWASVGTVLVAALALLVVLPFGGTPEVEPVSVAALAEVDAAPPSPRAPAAEAAPAEEVPEAALPSSAASPLAGAAAMPGLLPAARQAIREARPQSTPSPADASPRAAAPQVASRAAEPPRPTPSWDTPDDVRTLSLRLQDLDEADALAWDEASSETFGVPASPSAGAPAGFRAVREGAPARARLRPDSTSVQR